MSGRELAATPVAETPREATGILGRLDSISDWLSPIVVKEVRQMVRGREFNYSFGLSLLVGLIVAFLGGADALNGGAAAGVWIFGALMGCLTLLGLAVVPLGAFNALRTERAERTLDLITLTVLSPRRIVIGKLLAQAVKLVTLFAGLSPFIAMSFLLGGIDLVTILISLAAVFMLSLWTCAACLFMSVVSKSRAASGILFGGIGFLFLFVFGVGRFAYVFIPGMSGRSAFGPGYGPTGSDWWWMLAVMTSVCLVTLVNLVLLAENRLTLATEDRTTALRVGFFVQFLLIVAWAVAPLLVHRPGYSVSDAITVLGGVGGVHLAAVAIFTVTEDLALSRRLLRQAKSPTPWGWLVAMSRPGGGRGAAYVLAQMALLVFVAWLMTPGLSEFHWLLAICGYICFFTGVPTCIGRMLAPARARAAQLRVAALLIFPVVMLVPDLLYYILVRPKVFDFAYSIRHVVNPIRTFTSWDIVERSGWQYLVLGLGSLGLIAYIILIEMGRRMNQIQSDANTPIDWPAVQTVAAAFRLAMPRAPIGGRLGERLGSGTGSSLEFQDYRQYSPGDDLRHVDWAGYARSEVLAVRLYREEVAPRIDLLLDVSRSMILTEQKSRAYGELFALLACASASTEADARIITSGGGEPQPLHRPEEIERALSCDAAFSALEESRLPFRRSSLRVVVSDFLFPHDPDVLVGRLARDGASLAMIQLTLPEEAEPAVEGGRRLLDVEGRGEFDLVIDEAAVHDYRARFGRLRLGLSRAARRAGATVAHVVAGTPLRDVARALATAGVIEAV